MHLYMLIIVIVQTCTCIYRASFQAKATSNISRVTVALLHHAGDVQEK